MSILSGLGILAGFLTTIAFLPQVIKVWQTHSTKDLSMVMLVVFSSGVFLWLLYGILKKDLPLIVSNSVTLILAITMLILKVRYQ